MSEIESKKILVFIVPMVGHINPVLGVINELVKNKAKVIFYSTNQFKETIERTGSEFREYSFFANSQRPPINQKAEEELILLMNNLLETCDKIFYELIHVIEQEKPDLIMYDTLCLPVKWVLGYLRANQQKYDKLPKAVLFSQSFVNVFEIYPKEIVSGFIKHGPGFPEKIQKVFQEQQRLNQKYNLNIQDPLKLVMDSREQLTMVSVFPELHPRVEIFDKSYHFIGPCISEVRQQEITDLKLKSLLELFKPINPISSIDQIDSHNPNQLKLVFASLGTLFNNNLFVFDEIIDAVKTFNDEDEKTRSKINSNQLRVIISVGSEAIKAYNKRIETENYILPDNIILLPTAPQIEILQRASLFITHCGMNSTTESIVNGVPMIAIPISADQPIVSYRIADELKLGLRLNTLELKSSQIRSCMHKIFSDSSFYQRMIDFSSVAKNYNGSKKSIEIINQFLKDN